MASRKYLYNLLLTVFNLLVPVLTFPYVARVLGPAGLGKAQFVLTFSQYIALLAALGIPIYGIREVARAKHDRQELSATVLELLLINSAMCAICFAGFLSLTLLHPHFRADAPLYLCAGVLVLTGFSSIDWLYAGLEAFRLIALRSIIIKSAAVALTFILVRQRGDAGAFVVINVAAVMANNAVNLWQVRKRLIWRWRGLRFRRHIRPLFFIFGTTIASTLYTTFDTVILGLLSGDKAVGLYTAATRLTKIAIPVITALGGTLVGEISLAMAERKGEGLEAVLNKSYAYIVLLGAPVSVMLFVFAPALVTIFSGAAFADAVLTMRIMAFLPLLIGLGYFWGYQIILPMQRERFLMYAALAGMTVSLLLNFLLTPRLHENGAAIANIASEIVVTICYFLLIRKLLTVSIQHRQLLQSLIASLPSALFLLAPPDFLAGNIWLSAGAGMAVSGALYLLIQTFVFKNGSLLSYKRKLIK